MPNEEVFVPETETKDLTPKLKFAIQIGVQIGLGLLGIAVTAATTIFVAKLTIEASEDK